MLQFLIGFLVGGMFGFIVCAVCTMANTEDRANNRRSKETGGKDAPSK